MLVLSRRVDEEIVFPNLNIRIKVVRSHGGRVSLGIDAPEFVEVFRGECLTNAANGAVDGTALRHRIRNFMNHAQLAVELYDRQMRRGDVDAANTTFLRLISQLRSADLDVPTSAVAPMLSQHEGPKVLVVDDDANERQLMAGLLEMDGCHVETAHDGNIAIDLLRRGSQPDIVLLDMQMPGLCGRETLAALRSGWDGLVVFGVSGSTPEQNGIVVGTPDGVDEWFEKPLNPNQLVQRMRQRLDTQKSVSA
nr:translational regulator CsrA [uncultured bacterium]